MRIAFIGAGGMGAPMARNLLRAGHAVSVYNRTPAKAAALSADGGQLASSPSEAARHAQVVITMLPNDDAVRQAVLGAAMDAMDSGAIHMCCGTISVECSKELAQAHEAVGQGYIACPVLGRPEAAAAAKLWMIAAGPPNSVQFCRPLMEALGRGITVIGEQPWQANIVKIGANFVIASMLETLGEAFALMRKADISVTGFLEIVNSLFNSPVYANYGKLIADEKFEPAGFRLKLGLKDVNLALAAGAQHAVPLPLASLLRDHYLQAMAQGEADLDWAAVARVAARNAGLGGNTRS
jgi:3-hydroxyisobutyrate dehydrogenase-like beta-hydroxyacid dehydrogenase